MAALNGVIPDLKHLYKKKCNNSVSHRPSTLKQSIRIRSITVDYRERRCDKISIETATQNSLYVVDKGIYS